MLGTSLAGKEHEFLAAVSVGVHVDNQGQTLALELFQSEVNDFDYLPFGISQSDCSAAEYFGSLVTRETNLMGSHEHFLGCWG